MFSKQIADSVISIISSESETLSKLAELFQKSCSKVEQLSVLTSLAALLMDDILEPPQQIITVWLLQAAFPGDIKENPFYEVLQFISQSGASNSNSYHQKLCDIISCLFSPDVQLNDYADKSVHEILDPNFSLADQSGSELVNISFPPLPRISPVIITKADPTATQITQHQLLRELLIDPSLWTDFDVPFCRQMPEITVPSMEEFQFMNINSIDGPPFLFDELQCLNNHTAAKVFIQHAQTRPLKDIEVDSILDEINTNPDIFKEFPLAKSQTEKILELNPQIGAIFTVEAAISNPAMFKQYEKSDITPSTIEIVKQTMIRAKPPPNDFFNNFLSNCSQILTDTKDHQTLRTKAALFCNLMVFLQENKIAFSKDNLLELHSLNIELEQRGIAEAKSLKVLLE
ncbi:hypothetical protein TRFO_11257 [Tritrichomonas foetus]|uniref:CCR4-NOT transcription complex subunit 11 n=1 Tax=Tritrichomonas foetus TaxID=1144522 RepID=A0A1J4JAA7_9EUKA|nr:hypothetical protein TRFO_11257 [Tritrichomonas foetus]|eukprot:OHS94196.1 hypothetical protein TRFO_11257 [Tritrichomonas foetus]